MNTKKKGCPCSMGIYMNKSDGRSLKVALEKSQCVRGAVFAGGLSEASEEQAALGTCWDFFSTCRLVVL